MRKREGLSLGKERIVKELEKSKILYIEPNILQKVSKDIKVKFDNNQQFVELIHKQFDDFPESLLDYILKHKNARIVVGTQAKAGIYIKKHLSAIVNPRRLVAETGVFQEEVVHLLDHLLGGQPNRIEITLSAGFGINPEVEKLGKEINDLFKKDVSFSSYMSKNEREYLAQAVRYYLQEDRETIAELAPSLYNILRDKFLNEDYWRRVL